MRRLWSRSTCQIDKVSKSSLNYNSLNKKKIIIKNRHSSPQELQPFLWKKMSVMIIAWIYFFSLMLVCSRSIKQWKYTFTGPFSFVPWSKFFKWKPFWSTQSVIVQLKEGRRLCYLKLTNFLNENFALILLCRCVWVKKNTCSVQSIEFWINNSFFKYINSIVLLPPPPVR